MKPSNHQTILGQGRFWAFAASAAAMIWGFWGMFGRAMDMFRAPEEDLSFAWYVPLFSLYVLWSERKKLLEAASSPESRPSWGGFLACLPCIALALLGTRGLQLRFEQLGFIGLVVALPWTFYGRRVAAHFVFPALYLAFTIPMAALMNPITLRLRFLASGTAIAVLNGCGVNAVREGTAIISQGAHPFSIDVAEPCSGLRSLFALMALTAAYSWFNQPTWPRRAALFAMSIPLAVLGNVVRVLTICCVAAYADQNFAMGFYHDYSGYVVFLVAIALMVACGEAITRFAEQRANLRGNGRAARSTSDASGRTASLAVQDENELGARSTGEGELGERIWPYLAAAILIAVFAFQASTPIGMVMEAPEVDLPKELPGFVVDDVRYCQRESCGRAIETRQLGDATNCPSCGAAMYICALGERRILPADTRFVKRSYRGIDGTEYLVSAVIGGVSKSSIHRPELCLPSQGFLMTTTVDLEATGRPFRAIKVIPPRGGAPRTLAYTFFNQDGVRTASHVRRVITDTWDRSVLNRVDRWVMITVHASSLDPVRGFDATRPRDRAALADFLGKITENLP